MCCGSADGTSAPQHGKINKKCISNWPNHNFGFKSKSVEKTNQMADKAKKCGSVCQGIMPRGWSANDDYCSRSC